MKIDITSDNVEIHIHQKKTKSKKSMQPSKNRFYKKPKQAVEFCRENGIDVSEDYIFGSRNDSKGNYTAEIKKDCFQKNWWLILNDTEREKLCIFYIPENSLDESKFKAREDRIENIRVKFLYKENENFLEFYSKTEFKEYLKTELSY